MTSLLQRQRDWTSKYEEDCGDYGKVNSTITGNPVSIYAMDPYEVVFMRYGGNALRVGAINPDSINSLLAATDAMNGRPNTYLSNLFGG